MAREKIMLGLAFYGRGFSLNNAAINNIGASSNGPSTAGRIVTESGMLSYFEICSAIKSGANEKWDDIQLVPSIQYGRNWIGYENERSLRIKVNYARQKCLGGIMIWSKDLDDFKGKFCDRGSYPLLNAVVNQIGDGTCLDSSVNIIVDSNIIVNPTSTTRTTTSTTQRTSISSSRLTSLITQTTTTRSTTTPSTTTTTTTKNPNEIINQILCTGKTELIANLDDCKSFFLCLNGFRTSISLISCPNRLYFDDKTSTCVSTIPVI
jgi:chitinase